MKIQTNYDLLNKVVESEKGFTLNKIAKYVGICTSASIVIDMALSSIIQEPPEKFILDVVFYAWFHTLCGTAVHKSVSGIGKLKANRDLIILILKLYRLNILTDLNLINKSYAYHTEYKIVDGEKGIPVLKQNKYIMLPVYENGEESEVSILQEHIIGTKTYELSQEEPPKKLKFAPNPA